MSKGYQAKKTKRDRISYIILCIALLLMIAFFVSEAFSEALVYNNCRTGNLFEFTGSYEMEFVPSLQRGDAFRIYLANGDVLTTTTVLLFNDGTIDQHLKLMEEYPALTFRYSSPLIGLSFVYHAVEINSPDGATCLLNINDSKDQSIGIMCISIVMSILVATLLVLVLLCKMPVIKRKTRR